MIREGLLANLDQVFKIVEYVRIIAEIVLVQGLPGLGNKMASVVQLAKADKKDDPHQVLDGEGIEEKSRASVEEYAPDLAFSGQEE